MFISLLIKETERMPIVEQLLERQERGHIIITVSTLVIAEVRPDELNPDLDPKQYKRIQELFDSDKLDYRALTPSIAERAREIGVQHPKLLPPDCVHIATAISAKASVLFTFDGHGPKRRRPAEMIRYNGLFGSPPLKICAPYIEEGPLFDAQKESKPVS
jgi:predicted nucleic acid-binding protein